MRSRCLISAPAFKERHRCSPRAFTRERALPFALVLTLILRKGARALQGMLNEAFGWLGAPTVTASAFCQARYQFKHTAFIELNREAVVLTMYEDGDYQRCWGLRILAVDGSKLLLPDNAPVREAFGTIAFSHGKTGQPQGERPYALASVLYDVLNRVALDATLARADAYEVDLAIGHLPYTAADDLLVMDRNYPSYRMAATLHQHQREFVIRCSRSSFKQARAMLRGEGADSQCVTLRPGTDQAAAIRAAGLAMTLPVRFVRVVLPTGEWEVLMTSLRDEQRYPTGDFLELYHLRWGIETFYGVLKGRLDLENFSGIAPEAIRQDYFAAIYLCGLETILTADAQAQLDARPTRQPQQVNRAVAFAAIKQQALDLLFSDAEPDTLCERLTALFLTNPVACRPQRKPPRRNPSDRALLDFHRRRKKHCY